jgi:hypothetical protein
MGIVALVAGIIGLMFSWAPGVGFILGAAGVGFGIGGVQTNSGRGMAIGGIVTGAIAMVIQVIIIFLLALLFG